MKEDSQKYPLLNPDSIYFSLSSLIFSVNEKRLHVGIEPGILPTFNISSPRSDAMILLKMLFIYNLHCTVLNIWTIKIFADNKVISDKSTLREYFF